MEYDFGDRRSSFKERRDRTYPRANGRPLGGGTAEKTGGGLTETGSGVSGGMKQSPYARFLAGLAKPIAYKDESQRRWNLAREREQSITKLQVEQGRKYMGGKGFIPGESGIADTAMSRIITAGGERMSRASREVALTEADRKKEYDMMNLQRMMGAGGLALTGEEGAQQRMLEYYRSKLGAETAEWKPWWQGMAGG